MENVDFASLVETRVILEEQIAFFAAERRTEKDVEDIRKALEAHIEKVIEGEEAVEEDMMFHLAIANASKNSVLKSLMLIIIPSIINDFPTLDFYKESNVYRAIEEHKRILEHIINEKPKLSAEAMRAHLQDLLDYSISLRG